MNSRRSVRLTVRVVVPLSRGPAGRVFRLDGETLDDEMRASVGPFALELPSFGIHAVVHPQKPSDFAVCSIVATVGPLDRLRALADASNAGSERWFEDLAATIGDAPYVTTLRALAVEGAERAGRDDTPAIGRKGVGRRLRSALGTELRRSVSLALEQAPEERAWRALRWMATLLPKDGSIRVEVVDGSSVELGWPHADVLRDDEGPDLIVFAGTLDDAELALAAARAERTHTPVLVSVPNVERSDAALHTIVTRAFPRFAELRARDESRWLALAFNDVVLHVDGAEATRRPVFGPAVWGVLALLIGSYRDTGGLGRVVGMAAQQRAPASWLPSSGCDAGTPIPTREFGSVRAQTDAASLGVTLLGSPLGGATFVLATAPTASASADACSLPAQIWVGKIVRFTRWALRSIPTDAPDDAIGELLSEAARGLLFPGLDRAARLGAHVAMRDDRSKHVVVEARMHASIAGESLSLVFPMARA